MSKQIEDQAARIAALEERLTLYEDNNAVAAKLAQLEIDYVALDVAGDEQRVTESRATAGPDTLGIGSAVSHGCGQAVELVGVDRPPITVVYSKDPAHNAVLPNGSVMPGQPSEEDMVEVFATNK